MGGEMTFDLDETEMADMIQAIGDVLKQHLRLLPHMVLIVRDGDAARTLFAGNNPTTGEEPHETMRLMLEQALATENRRHPQVKQ
jgi:hypothetical protein